MSKIQIEESSIASLEEYLNLKNRPSGVIQLTWLGQAGFAIHFKNKLFIIDPYLSDYLSKKYKGKLFPHIRLMDIPILPEKIRNLDYILSTHAHSDHMDPETITVLSQNNPKCKMIVPSAEIEEAINRGARHEHLISANAEQIIKIDNDLKIIGMAAAHEKLKVNEKGEHHFLGYIFCLDEIKIYHSGDCIPYEGLSKKLKNLEIDIALLPINGRDEYRLENGIAGNFKIPEVLNLCKQAKIEHLIVHHFGMFAYNTVSDEQLRSLEKISSKNLKIIIPKINQAYKIIKN
ncbi:MAG: MBL fold metallo-hydrolase [Promethearchaeota archaeon]|nr:MAG: MBL fold metallo-hydrolase [Candidatus Lokiarchaeota archaeon]